MPLTVEPKMIKFVEKALVHAALEGSGVVDADAVLALCKAPAADKAALIEGIVDGNEFDLLRHVANSNENVIDAVNLFQVGLDTRYAVDTELLDLIPQAKLLKYAVLPMRDQKTNELCVVVAKPDQNVKEILTEHVTEGSWKFLLARGTEIRQYINNVKSRYGAAATTQAAAAVETKVGPASRAEEWVQNLLRSAVNAGASEIHLLQDEKTGLTVRMRIDDILHKQITPPGSPKEYITAFLTKVPNIDATNRRLPMDGSLRFDSGQGREFDSRVAVCPTVDDGVSVTIRLLDPQNIDRKLSDSGFTAEQLALLEGSKGTAASQGLVVVSGPTGSGKTTTLYSLIKNVAGSNTKTITVEDPVEYRIDHVDQVEVTRRDDPSKSLTFERALRSILRSDPDNVLVGEIRDEETAQMTLDAAITGHLVLSTIHTRSAAGIYSRLAEMNRPLYMIAEALSLGVAQRLARRLHSCATERPIRDDERKQFEDYGMVAPQTVPEKVGCSDCTEGYRGRIGIAEVLDPSTAVKELVLAGATAEQIEECARSEGFQTMFEVGLLHVTNGITDLSEVRRVVTQ